MGIYLLLFILKIHTSVSSGGENIFDKSKIFMDVSREMKMSSRDLISYSPHFAIEERIKI